MTRQLPFLKALLDSLVDQIAVLDRTGTIVYVNHAWKQFGCSNGMAANHEWVGDNYLDTCRRAGIAGDQLAEDIAHRFELLFNGTTSEFELEYPCHAPRHRRWFIMRATAVCRFEGLFVVSHVNVSARKLAEERASRLALADPLCGIANRRRFEQVLKDEWRRWRRGVQPISLLMVDIDQFKSYNDAFGHPAGDRCLRAVARTLAPFARRAGDIVARLGGEEFALLLPGMGHSGARTFAEDLRSTLAAIPNGGLLKRSISVSIGAVTAESGWPGSMNDLLHRVDEQLYAAKKAGRNRVHSMALAGSKGDFDSPLTHRIHEIPTVATSSGRRARAGGSHSATLEQSIEGIPDQT
ncbi:MAG: sensor domain-containing diguanylate cyclase [Nitrospiraceae bacterium]